jgi:hypothetical protein
MNKSIATNELNSRPYLAVAVVLFLVAATTGAVLRFGLLVGMPAGWNYTYLRHAHSHLMYFGWVTLALMALTYQTLPALTGRALPHPRLARWQLTATAFAAILTFPAFATSGYGLTRIGDVELPLSIMAATLNILTWYVFAGLYWHASRGVRRSLALRALDGAVVFIVLASFGAWGIGLLTALGSHNRFLGAAAPHFFLDLFSDGWFILGTLGLLFARLGELARPPRFSQGQLRTRPQNSTDSATYLGSQSKPRRSVSGKEARWALWLVLVGLPPTFLLSIPVSMVPSGLRFLAGLGGLTVASGFIILIGQLWSVRSRLPRIMPAALVCFAIKAVAEALLAFPGIARWAAGTQLRVFYLHTLLLGFVTLALAALIGDVLNLRGRLRRWNDDLLMAGTAAMLIALLGLAFIRWVPFGPRPLLWLAAWSSIAILIAMAGLFIGTGTRGWQTTSARQPGLEAQAAGHARGSR